MTGLGDPMVPFSVPRVLRALAVLCLIVLVLPYVALAVLGLLDGENSAANLSWVMLIFGGFAFLVVTLFSAAILFRVFDLHDRAHSLALPRNTIRTLLTFLIFLILLAFIFYSSHIVTSRTADGSLTIDRAGFSQMVRELGLEGRVTEVKPVPPDEANGADLLSVRFLVEQESVAQEYFDRILIALLGISSTIIGFYFGSRTREDPGQSMDGGTANGAPVDEGNANKGSSAPGAAQKQDTGNPAAPSAGAGIGGGWAPDAARLMLASRPDGTLHGTLPVQGHLPPAADLDARIPGLDPDIAEIDLSPSDSGLQITLSGVDPADLPDEMEIEIRSKTTPGRAHRVKLGLG